MNLRAGTRLLLSLLMWAWIVDSAGAAASPCSMEGATPFLIWMTVPPSLQASCLPGFYCPFINPLDNSTWPAICPPTPQCTKDRLGRKFCSPQGLYEPQLCKEGYYCPDFLTQKICPEGYYCPMGSSSPRRCPVLASCPEGSAKS
eukprot:RCo021602